MPIEYISDELHAAMLDIDFDIDAIFRKLSVRPESARTRDERLAVRLAGKNDPRPSARGDQAASYRVRRAECVPIRNSDLYNFKGYISGLVLTAAAAEPEPKGDALRSISEALDEDESWFEEGDLNTSLHTAYERWRVLEEDEQAAFEARVSDHCLRGSDVPSDMLVFLGYCHEIAGAVLADTYFEADPLISQPSFIAASLDAQKGLRSLAS